jgi:hypothetical protein
MPDEVKTYFVEVPLSEDDLPRDGRRRVTLQGSGRSYRQPCRSITLSGVTRKRRDRGCPPTDRPSFDHSARIVGHILVGKPNLNSLGPSSVL